VCSLPVQRGGGDRRVEHKNTEYEQGELVFKATRQVVGNPRNTYVTRDADPVLVRGSLRSLIPPSRSLYLSLSRIDEESY